MIFQISPKLSVALEICRRLIGKLFNKRGRVCCYLLMHSGINTLWYLPKI